MGKSSPPSNSSDSTAACWAFKPSRLRVVHQHGLRVSQNHTMMVPERKLSVKVANALGYRTLTSPYGGLWKIVDCKQPDYLAIFMDIKNPRLRLGVTVTDEAQCSATSQLFTMLGSFSTRACPVIVTGSKSSASETRLYPMYTAITTRRCA
jgi:hypothetical protein